MAFIAPSLPKVCAAPVPLIKAPITTNIPQIIAAVVKRTMRVPTAVPNTLAASLAPSDQPRNRPLLKKMRTVGSSKTKFFEVFGNIDALLDHFSKETARSILVLGSVKR